MMKLLDVLFCLFTVMLLWKSNAQGGRLHPQWCSFIADLCRKFEGNPTGSTLIYLHQEFSTDHPYLHLLPPVLIWAPVEQFSDVFPNGFCCPKCDSLSSSRLYGYDWMDGVGSERTEPRKIHGRDGVVLLVGRRYKCAKVAHEVVSYHPGILRQLNTLGPSLTPFRLWARTGFTSVRTNDIVTQMVSGVSASTIASNLVSATVLQYSMKRKRFFELQGISQHFGNDFPSYEQWISLLPAIAPSRHAISACFLSSFWEKQSLFEKHMQSTTITDADSWLSCDHTFASAGNIGLVRNFDCRWITQFSALFCVLNGHGQVVTWKLTKNMTFSNIEDHLVLLHDRLSMQGKRVTEFYIDNCCSWRCKLQQVFGSELCVRLDVFHAVKRISDKIPKRHPLRHDCMKDLTVVFRDPADRGESRLLETPSPATLASQLEHFLQKWENAEYSGWKVLSASAMKEAQNLKKHMLNGCLSGIKPGRGTNRNEALHKELNKIVSSSRYGLELAYALFTSIFFQHNERLAAKLEQRREKAILEYDDYFKDNPTTGEYFGLQWVRNTVSNQNIDDSNKPLTLYRSSYSDFLQRINNGGRIDAVINEFEPSNEQSDLPFHDEEQEDIPLAMLKVILLKALSWYFVHEHMSKQTKRARIPLKELPFMNSALTQLFNSGCLETPDDGNKLDKILLESTNQEKIVSIHLNRLDLVLESWNFKRIPVSGDGNCLFHALSHALLKKGDSSILLRLGCSPVASVMELAKVLRQATVTEWLGENSNVYQSFLTHSQLCEEAQRFLQDGEYSGDIGDLVLSALANVLSIPITVFTSAQSMPILTLLPTSSVPTDSHPLFIAYNQDGPGHYDAVCHVDRVLDKENTCTLSESQLEKCTCGRNSSKGVSCTYSLYHYSTKCPCFKAGQSCNSNCRCKGCKNPNGQRPDIKTSIHKRKRDRHDSQDYPLKGKKTTKFMEEVVEEVTTGSMSNFEYLLVSAIVHHSYPDAEDWTDVQSFNTDIIIKYFESIRNITQLLNMQLPMFKRSKFEIEKALKHYRSQFEIFYKLHT